MRRAHQQGEGAMHAKRVVAVRMLLLLLLLPIFAMPAPSRGQSSPDRDKAAEQSKQPRAPVGHRQPTAADAPKERPKDAAEIANEKRERELDAKLQICRGC
jgi:hypothetical protein